jgi:hypothetical protein
MNTIHKSTLSLECHVYERGRWNMIAKGDNGYSPYGNQQVLHSSYFSFPKPIILHDKTPVFRVILEPSSIFDSRSTTVNDGPLVYPSSIFDSRSTTVDDGPLVFPSSIFDSRSTTVNDGAYGFPE